MESNVSSVAPLAPPVLRYRHLVPPAWDTKTSRMRKHPHQHKERFYREDAQRIAAKREAEYRKLKRRADGKYDGDVRPIVRYGNEKKEVAMWNAEWGEEQEGTNSPTRWGIAAREQTARLPQKFVAILLQRAYRAGIFFPRGKAFDPWAPKFSLASS